MRLLVTALILAACAALPSFAGENDRLRVRVILWEGIAKSHAEVTGVALGSKFGHSALMIGDVNNNTPGAYAYISWGRAGSFSADVNDYNYTDGFAKVLEMESITPQQLEDLQRWYQDYRKTAYHMLKNNCAHAVAKAMQVLYKHDFTGIVVTRPQQLLEDAATYLRSKRLTPHMMVKTVPMWSKERFN